MTKKQAALNLLGLALSMSRGAGDEDVDVWIVRLLWVAAGLDPAILHHPRYLDAALGGGDSRVAKLRRLIEHPSTRPAEREAAVAALARVRS